MKNQEQIMKEVKELIYMIRDQKKDNPKLMETLVGKVILLKVEDLCKKMECSIDLEILKEIN